MKEFDVSTYWWCFIIAAVVCYFIGCFNFAVLISHIKKKDIRDMGSGNPGTMNMMRSFGLKIGIFNFLCDAFKGGVPVVISYFIFRNFYFAGTQVYVSDFFRYFCGVFVIIGHIFPVTMKFKGGKGIASTLGLFWLSLACEEWWFIFIGTVLLILVLVYIGVFEWGSMGSLLGVSVFSLWQAVIFFVRYSAMLSQGWVIACFMALIALNLLTWVAHHKNIYKLLGGEEHHTSIKRMLHKKLKNKQ